MKVKRTRIIKKQVKLHYDKKKKERRKIKKGRYKYKQKAGKRKHIIK